MTAGSEDWLILVKEYSYLLEFLAVFNSRGMFRYFEGIKDFAIKHIQLYECA
jgi:hypothetical protein